MTTIDQAKKNPLVIASYPTVTLFGSSFFDVSKTDTQLGIIKKGEKVGVIVAVYPIATGNNIAKVQLLTPIKKLFGFVSFNHAYIYLSSVEPVSSLLPIMAQNKQYWCLRDNVKIREKASSLSKTLPQKLGKADPIGTSNGVVQNGYLKFDLIFGGTGFVSKDFVTLQKIEKPIIEKEIKIPTPLVNAQSITVPVLPEIESSIDVKKILITTGISVVAGYILTKIIKLFGV